MERDCDVTQILQRIAEGDRADAGALLDAVYDDLHRLASQRMRGERVGHTLQPTALVNEAYMRLIDQNRVEWRDRTHFFAVASEIIRRILVDHARSHQAAKRGGGRPRVAIDNVEPASERDVNLVALDDALIRLADIDATQARIVELRFFGGLTIEETAEVMDMGRRSVDREWSCAKAWLYRELGPA